MPLSRPSPLDSLHRRIVWLLTLALVTLLMSALVLRLFEQEGRRTSTRLVEFHGPTLLAAEESLRALGELRLDTTDGSQSPQPAVSQTPQMEQARRARRLLNLVERQLTQIVALQRKHAWADTARTMARIETHLAEVKAALETPLPGSLTPRSDALTLRSDALTLALDQLRLLHQEEQVALLRGQAARTDTFYRFGIPALALLLLVGLTLAWLVWRGIRHSLATEDKLREGLMTEINERRQVEEELRLKDKVIATSINGIAIADAKGRIIYANPAFRAMWRIDDRAALDTLFTADLWHAQAGPGAHHHDGAVSGEAAAPAQDVHSEAGWLGEVTAVRADRSKFPALLSSTAVKDAGGQMTHMMASFIDQTESHAVQAQLIQSQKLESVGRLAGGVAHDFNNLLLVIQGYVEMAQERAAGDSELLQHLKEVSRATSSAATLTSQLLTFSRRQIIAPVVLDLNAVVHSIHGMLHRVLGEDILLQTRTAPDLWRVRFDPGQTEQILLNLAVNARDAMPNGGQLTIETSNVSLDAHYAHEHPGTTPGEYVMLAVSDTGVGMSAETQEHAFEPFFTTKGPGQGTGLGLAIIHGAVAQNGGRIELYSEPGHGTTFKIYLPRTIDTERAAPASADHRPVGHETILVVEDDPSVRTLARRLLERQGYVVHAFGEPEAALAWLREGAIPVDLLFTDVIMPQMNGKELAAAVTALRPDIKVLYVSGYTADVIVLHGVLKPGMAFLAKPYTQNALATKIRQVLDGQT